MLQSMFRRLISLITETNMTNILCTLKLDHIWQKMIKSYQHSCRNTTEVLGPRLLTKCLYITPHININPLNAELNPICHLLALLGVHHFLHVSRIRVKSLTFRLLMSYIQGVSKRALQLWKLIKIYTEDIHNVLNCQNVAKHAKFYLG
jgi:hypothetical protein